MIAHGKVGEERPTCVRPPSRRGNCSGYRLESNMNREIKHIEKLDIVDIMARSRRIPELPIFSTHAGILSAKTR